MGRILTGAAILIIILFISLIYKSDQDIKNSIKNSIKNEVRRIRELAYADGQRDFYKGNVNFDSYRNCWISSPWTNKKEPSTYVRCDNE